MDTSLTPTFKDDGTSYAMGALQLRKRHNRKKLSTGELIWDDSADVGLTLGLIKWTSNRSHRKGNRRAVFLQEFLGSRGISKTKKQISSRLQVLKNEWNETPYQELLKNPDNPESCLPIGTAGSHQELFTSNTTLGTDHVYIRPSEGSSSFHVTIPPHRPDFQHHGTVGHEHSAPHTQPKTADSSAAWSPSDFSRPFGGDNPAEKEPLCEYCYPNSVF